MAKRRQRDSDESEYEGHESSRDDSDASFTAEPRKTLTKSRHSRQKKRAKNAPECVASPSAVVRHCKRTHVLAKPAEVRNALLAWYDLVRDSRGMPWRKAFDASYGRAERAQRAYEVWVSEIMLQQTQVATVIPYYNRWMDKFPTIAALAEATIDEVNSLWKGLGYYSRASRLLAGAQKVVCEHEGYLPDNAKDMEAQIPGIGRYSAGAICSIAYGEKVPVLDGNVHRLLSRVLTLHANPKSKATLDILWTAAEAMVNVKGSYRDANYQNPGDVNQALIELGSTVCKVQNPTCASCPLKDHCGAYRLATASQRPADIGDLEDLCTICEPLPKAFEVTFLPMKAEKKKAREETDSVSVVEWRASPTSADRWFLLVKRPEKGLLAGLYEFPTQGNVSGTASMEELTSGVHDLLGHILASPARWKDGASKLDANDEKVEFETPQVKPVGDILHLFSHVRKTYRAQWVLLEGGVSPPALTAITKATTHPKKKSAKARGKATAIDAHEFTPVDVKWVRMNEVDGQNLSTGMVKVWNLVKAQW